MNYYAIVHHDPGSAYGVSFPDIPDCFAAADEEEDVLKNAALALEDYFEDGHAMPAASKMSDLAREYHDDLAEGAFFISVPVIELLTKTVRAQISMEQGLLKAIDEAAKRLNLSRSSFLAQAAKKEITGLRDVA